MSNTVFIATSLDGYIADKDGGLDWLQSIPNPENLDMGYVDLIGRVDAVVMGRKTFEKVSSFDCDWPYSKLVFVLSNFMKSIPEGYEGKAEPIKGSLSEVMEAIHQKGHKHLYIDGGVTVQNFLKEDLIDEISQNYAIAMVTHSMQQAARVSQRVAYFHLGHLVEVGLTDDIFTNPRHKLTEDYITGRIG